MMRVQEQRQKEISTTSQDDSVSNTTDNQQLGIGIQLPASSFDDQTKKDSESVKNANEDTTPITQPFTMIKHQHTSSTTSNPASGSVTNTASKSKQKAMSKQEELAHKKRKAKYDLILKQSRIKKEQDAVAAE